MEPARAQNRAAARVRKQIQDYQAATGRMPAGGRAFMAVSEGVGGT